MYVEYTFPEQFGTGKVWYCFPIGRLIVLEGGFVLPVEKLKVGNRFLMQRGVIATVTEVHEPEWYDPPSTKPDAEGLYYKRVIGKVEHTGNVVMDVSFLGMTVTSTPDHGYFSVTRNRYVPAAYLQVGELLQTPEGQTAKVDAVSPPRYGLVKLYNIEVEDFHNYFVGGANGAVQVHNGVPGACIPMPAEATEETVQSARLAYLGRTPSKWSATGLAVQERMALEGTLVGEGADAQVMYQHPLTGEEGWVSIVDTDMAHLEDAVTWWNNVGIKLGPKSPAVRAWMLDSANYELQPYWINRSLGARLRVTYQVPE